MQCCGEKMHRHDCYHYSTAIINGHDTVRGIMAIYTCVICGKQILWRLRGKSEMIQPPIFQAVDEFIENTSTTSVFALNSNFWDILDPEFL